MLGSGGLEANEGVFRPLRDLFCLFDGVPAMNGWAIFERTMWKFYLTKFDFCDKIGVVL